MNKYILVLIISIFSLSALAQSKDDEARMLYQRAQDNYDARQYRDALSNLGKAIDIVGYNPKTEYLNIKIFWDAMKNGVLPNEESYHLTVSKLLGKIFSQIDKNTYPPEKYSELISIKLDNDDALAKFADNRAVKQQQHADSLAVLEKKHADLKRREIDFLRDTFDVYMNTFVRELMGMNDLNFKPSRKLVKFWIEHNNHPPVKVEYRPVTKQLVLLLFDPANVDVPCCPETIYVLCPIQLEPSVYAGDLDDAVDFLHPINTGKSQNFNGKQWLTEHSYHVPRSIVTLKNILDQTGFGEYFANRIIDETGQSTKPLK